MAHITFDEALGYFQQPDSEGHSLFDHMTTVVAQILSDKPADPRAAFEHYSATTKSRKPLAAIAIDAPVEIPEAVKNAQAEKASNAALASSVKMFAKAEKAKGEEEEEADDGAAADVDMPNLLEEFGFYRMIGIGLNQIDALRLFLTVKNLVVKHQLTGVRFFGKITAIRGEYYIVESDLKADEGEEQEATGDESPVDEGEQEGPKRPKPKAPVVVPPEKQSGPNKYTYWVTTSLGGEWIKLPEVTPAQIAVARKIRKAFTGSLDVPVLSYPAFSGTEAHYLRAQISRIAHATTISPKGFYHFGEEADEDTLANGDPEVNAEMEEPDLSELAKKSSWVHHRRYILPQGRISYWSPPKEPKEGEEEEEEGEEDKPDPNRETGPALLTAISDDKFLRNFPAWSFRSPSGGLLKSKYIPVFLASNIWPGSFSYGEISFLKNGKMRCMETLFLP
eukprot:TRINITY_DN866_c0_g1_i1.p1 TRINITY_DN866_c0_g1~~TRINITY_DN866_c0_g1_i1.p1  ORF type:complete len:450 (+),score=111.36 TRINITY_DN866_c0_g1_i1:920-2269(+)